MSETAPVKYVFLDIVGFTRNRTVEAQSDLVAKLNDIVSAAINEVAAEEKQKILLPTGDGMAIVLLNTRSWDVHLRLGLEILRRVAESNDKTEDQMRKFDVRVGINENVDNVVLDINGNRNVAGYGISLAQRIMDQADGGQLLLGQAVYEILSPREKYVRAFKGFQATVKHGVTLPVYQYIVRDSPGVNVNVPAVFVQKTSQPARFTKFVAYYIAHAITHRAFLLGKTSDHHRDEAGVVLLSFLAEDSVETAETPSHEVPILMTWNAGKVSFDEQYSHYRAIEGWVLSRFAKLLANENLSRYADYFDESSYKINFVFVKPTALPKLRAEWPKIAEQFKI